MSSDNYILTQSTRFFPHWNNQCGSQVAGLINLINYILDKNINAQTWCEIGSNLGESALIISSFPQISKLYCVDYFWDGDKQYNEFIKRTEINKNKIELLRCKSHELYQSFPQQVLDVIYVDGNHEYEFVKNDLEFAYRVTKQNGFICGHDYNNQHAGCRQAIDEFLTMKRLKISKIFCDTSFIIEKS
jgi:predicted O-methyltransferase YrrM